MTLQQTSAMPSKCAPKSRKGAAAQDSGGGGGGGETVGEGESVDKARHSGVGFKVAGDVDCCCLEYLLATQEDFQSQENAVEEYVKGRGHLCIFLPKYHPGNATSHICSPRRVRFLCVSLALTFSRCVESELNFIERYCGRSGSCATTATTR
jgi:hypothetical protein